VTISVETRLVDLQRAPEWTYTHPISRSSRPAMTDSSSSPALQNLSSELGQGKSPSPADRRAEALAATASGGSSLGAGRLPNAVMKDAGSASASCAAPVDWPERFADFLTLRLSRALLCGARTIAVCSSATPCWLSPTWISPSTIAGRTRASSAREGDVGSSNSLRRSRRPILRRVCREDRDRQHDIREVPVVLALSAATLCSYELQRRSHGSRSSHRRRRHARHACARDHRLAACDRDPDPNCKRAWRIG
jgi:hypothetical protein